MGPVSSAEELQARRAQAAWLRGRARWWLFWAFLGFAMLFARVFVLPHFDVVSAEWPGRTLALALLLLVGGSIQYKLTLRRADAIAGGSSAGDAFASVRDPSLAALAEIAEEATNVASEL